MIFNGAAEADVTAEGQTKSSYEQDLNYVSGKTFKVQTTTRVTSELKWADEDNRFQIIQSIQADQEMCIRDRSTTSKSLSIEADQPAAIS